MCSASCSRNCTNGASSQMISVFQMTGRVLNSCTVGSVGRTPTVPDAELVGVIARLHIDFSRSPCFHRLPYRALHFEGSSAALLHGEQAVASLFAWSWADQLIRVMIS